MLTYLVEHAFAGLWTLIWHFGVGIGIIILLCAAAYFAPSVKLKVICVALAAVVAAFVIGEAEGVRLEKKHVDAQQAETNTFINKTVKGTTTVKSRGKADPWNSKAN